MGINAQHPSYDAMQDRWRTCREVVEGSEAVKAAGRRYLPRLVGQSNSEYKAYVQRALFYGITSKTVSALTGMATMRAPKLEYPEEMAGYFKDNSGLQFMELWCTALDDDLLVGRIGGLVDAPATGGDPYITLYPTESIINWDTDENDRYVMVVLLETFYEQDPNDRFKRNLVTQYRLLDLVDGVYTQTIYNAKGEPGESVTPTFTGQTLDYIPFYTATPGGIGSGFAKPPMMDIVNINISHYVTSADLEHGRHFTGLPTPVAIGVDANTTLHLGSMTAWCIPDPQGDAKYLEFTGQGLSSLENALKEKERQVASMSSRFIDNSARGSENANVVTMRHSSETASLTITVTAVEALFNLLYKTIAKLKKLDEDSVLVTMHKDFMSQKLSGQEIKALVEAYTLGGMSKETLLYNLRQGLVVDPNRKDEDELEEIGATNTVTKPQPAA